MCYRNMSTLLVKDKNRGVVNVTSCLKFLSSIVGRQTVLQTAITYGYSANENDTARRISAVVAQLPWSIELSATLPEWHITCTKL
jgi:hypothetical protein